MGCVLAALLMRGAKVWVSYIVCSVLPVHRACAGGHLGHVASAHGGDGRGAEGVWRIL